MPIRCPSCGSRNLRPARLRNPKEFLRILMGFQPIRCRNCRTRFTQRVWRPSDVWYARCPKCLREDLNTWSESRYRVPPHKMVLLRFGANPYRCESCRYNFVTFRRRRRKSGFGRRRNTEPGELTSSRCAGHNGGADG